MHACVYREVGGALVAETHRGAAHRLHHGALCPCLDSCVCEHAGVFLLYCSATKSTRVLTRRRRPGEWFGKNCAFVFRLICLPFLCFGAVCPRRTLEYLIYFGRFDHHGAYVCARTQQRCAPCMCLFYSFLYRI